MNEDSILREEIRHSLRHLRLMIHSYSGLYAGEDLARDVLRTCDEIARPTQPSPRFKEARRLVQERCAKLAHDADRYSMRDPAMIAISRAKAVASVDMLQDALFELRKAERGAPRPGSYLKRPSL
ncbi:hypothetical protein [Microvirga solisilvae]|uniref:hypothetical protein n=1 Tax=Microvirga solisilvae TaxID=2919498 RepID=UPI001FAECE77|nr:hypothetical protein [Microvirga solisilvae]